MDTTDTMTQLREQYTYYARRLLSDLGLGDLGQSERNQLLVAIESYVQQIVFNTILESLDENSLKKADAMMAAGKNQDEVMVHLIATLPDIDLRIADNLALAYAQMLEDTRQLSQALTRKEQGAQPSNILPSQPASSGQE